MRSKAEIEDLRNTLGAMIDLQKMTLPNDMIAAVHNALCFILDDGSPHAATFAKNYRNLLGWCEKMGIRFVKTKPPERPM